MTTATELLRHGRVHEVWRKYCGFLDLSLGEFMEVQKHLLMEQMGLLSKCELGRQFFKGATLRTVEEFRQNVPLTSYTDYAVALEERKEEILPRKPEWWLHTSGRSGYGFKWVPYTPEMVKKLGEVTLAVFMLAAATRRGDIGLREGDAFLNALAPFPYYSGATARAVLREFDFAVLPSLEAGDKMSFQERVQAGFREGLINGFDGFNGVASVLVRIGEQFERPAGGPRRSQMPLHPQALFRMAMGMVRAGLRGRKRPLPKDLWHVKFIATGGTDVAMFKDRIESQWGRKPLEAYGGTEFMLLSTQVWNYRGLTFRPDLAFLEFIPEEASYRMREDPGYQPATVLLDELEAGHRYEIVGTSFMGGAFVRYRVGDMIEIVALQDEETRIRLPQMTMHARVDDIIDLAGFTRLTEKDIWRAIEATGVPYADWTAWKDAMSGRPVLHLYIEPRLEPGIDEFAQAIHANLREIHEHYADLEDMLGYYPLRVSLLPRGSFDRYYQLKQSEGADLAHLKPPHMNPRQEVIGQLLALGRESG